MRNSETEKEEESKKKYLEDLRYEKKAYTGQIWGGIVAMIGSAAWFIGGLFTDVMYSYPPILFIFGIIGLIRGIVARNNAQKKTSTDVLDEDF